LEKSEKSFNGTVPLNFTIDASGHVIKAKITETTQIPEETTNCLINVLKGIRFPHSIDGTQTEVNQPFNFYPR